MTSSRKQRCCGGGGGGNTRLGKRRRVRISPLKLLRNNRRQRWGPHRRINQQRLRRMWHIRETVAVAVAAIASSAVPLHNRRRQHRHAWGRVLCGEGCGGEKQKAKSGNESRDDGGKGSCGCSASSSLSPKNGGGLGWQCIASSSGITIGADYMLSNPRRQRRPQLRHSLQKQSLRGRIGISRPIEAIKRHRSRRGEGKRAAPILPTTSAVLAARSGQEGRE